MLNFIITFTNLQVPEFPSPCTAFCHLVALYWYGIYLSTYCYIRKHLEETMKMLGTFLSKTNYHSEICKNENFSERVIDKTQTYSFNVFGSFFIFYWFFYIYICCWKFNADFKLIKTIGHCAHFYFLQKMMLNTPTFAKEFWLYLDIKS